MSSDERISTKVQVGGRPFSLLIGQNEDPLVQEAAEWINDRLAQYRERYPTKDYQDFLSMIALQLVKDKLQNKNTGGANKILVEELSTLDERLDNYLQGVQNS